LIRIALVHEGEGLVRRVVLDHSGTLPGRGAYLCRGDAPGDPASPCVILARRRGAIARALRCSSSDRSVAIDPKLVESVSR
jgi:predicted RNA-binding protein YlxR (DUF448 family)